jgi:hypothetical protein
MEEEKCQMQSGEMDGDQFGRPGTAKKKRRKK